MKPRVLRPPETATWRCWSGRESTVVRGTAAQRGVRQNMGASASSIGSSAMAAPTTGKCTLALPAGGTSRF
eukprot:m.477549 g.477549  ORF g.477549 m.477549 type:complete len:71 (+) comp43989_c0_seq1:487-699(+)